MENEENKGFIDKKDSKDQMTSLVILDLELSHYSLSLTLGHSDFFWSNLELEQERQ